MWINESGRAINMQLDERLDWRNRILMSPPEKDDPWHSLLRWRLSPASSRTVTFQSLVTVPEHIEREVTWAISHLLVTKPNDESAHIYRSLLVDAYHLDPRHPLIHVALAAVERNPIRQDFLRTYGIQRLVCAESMPDKPGHGLLAGEYRAKAAVILAIQSDLTRAKQVYAKLIADYPQWGSAAWIDKLESFEWPHVFCSELLELSGQSVKKPHEAKAQVSPGN